jgi:hypothetical protein
VPPLQKIQMMPGSGHSTQQEWSNEVGSAIIDFIRRLPS